MTYEEYCEDRGVEPECDSCVHSSRGHCMLREEQGIDCDGKENFEGDGR